MILPIKQNDKLIFVEKKKKNNRNTLTGFVESLHLQFNLIMPISDNGEWEHALE